jgi:Flp pilus assembly protein TadG
VELAVVAPFLVFLALGTVDFGRYAKESISVNNASRNGAYFGSVDTNPPAALPDQAGIKNAVLQDLQTVEGVTSADVTVTSSFRTDAESYQLVSVTVSVPFKTLYGFPTAGVTLAQTCEMRMRPDQSRTDGK